MQSICKKIFRICSGPKFGQQIELSDALEEISHKKLIVFGEIHANPTVIELQRQIQESLIKDKSNKVSVVMEHFSFEMQHLLDNYAAGKMNLTQVHEAYKEIGTEGHDILKYEPLLEHAKQNAEQVKIHAGFIPRTYAKMVMRQSLEDALKAAKEKNYIDKDETCEGSDDHYNYFESLIQGRNINDGKPTGQFKKMFPAQVIKDAAMAHYVNQLVEKQNSDNEKIVVICGKGHMGYSYGVPERIFAKNPKLKDNSYSIYAMQADSNVKPTNKDIADDLKNVLGDRVAASDIAFLFDDQPVEEAKGDNPDDVKRETAAAYDKVGDSAHIGGNLKKAEKVMTYIGYTPEQIKIAGSDAYNYQGVGNPHKFAHIKNGEKVLDLGSGLGIDSFIASASVGEEGSVVGIDISKSEVKHAGERAKARGLKNLEFKVEDMEKMSFEDNSFDCVISNGAFCLAPNKKAAFTEIYRILKPGGRFSICTSTVKQNLQSGVNWPICMRMFIHIDAIKPICQEVGFENVEIDDSNSLMQYEIEMDPKEGETKPERKQIHVGSDEFKHLKDYNMNELCARIVVMGKKPEK